MPPSSGVPPWRRPSARCLINGLPMVGLTGAEVIATNAYAASRFSVTAALGTDPVLTGEFWAASAGVLAELRFSLDGQSFTSLIQGMVDSVELDPISGTVRLEGRDLTAALIETRTQETFSNRTASEIATILAGRHGLTAAVTTTTTPVGRYYQNEHDRITLDQFSHATTEWDLLVFLARQEGFDVFIQGTTLHFQPPAAGQAPTMEVRPADVIALRLNRSLTLARDIEVTVKSWNSRQRSAFTQTARASGQPASGTRAGPATPPQRYVLVRPNLTPNQALQLAQSRLAELTQHERIIDLLLPGELSLTPRSRLSLSGSGTGFDQIYYVETIERDFHQANGFTQRIRARNSSPRSETTAPADTVGSVTG